MSKHLSLSGSHFRTRYSVLLAANPRSSVERGQAKRRSVAASADSGITIQRQSLPTVSFSGDMAYHYALEQCTIGHGPLARKRVGDRRLT